MVFDEIQEKYVPRDNDFYCNHYHHVLYALMGLIVVIIVLVGVLFYQFIHRPLPQFDAVEPGGARISLQPYLEPNLRSDTILKWASKAAVVAYTYDYVRYNAQLNNIRPYFTEAGWKDYLNSVRTLLATIVKNKLIVNSIVAGTPVIANQGPLPGKDYVWRIQIPFLVSYQSANTVAKRSFMVELSIVQVPPNENPQGIGIDQFVMR